MDDVRRTRRQDGFLPGGVTFHGLLRAGVCCLSLGRGARRSILAGEAEVVSMDMPVPGLGRGLSGARLVHLTDLHCGPLVPPRFLRRCVAQANALEPDFVVVTGDLITVGQRRVARAVADILADLSPSIAALAVLGNHDYGLWHPNGFGGVPGLAEYMTACLDDAGVIVLNNESRDFFRGGSGLQFAGTEDVWTNRYDPDRAFKTVRPGVPVIGLVHNPDAAADFAGRGAQWILAGHTHGVRSRDTRLRDALFPAGHRRFVAGRYDLGGGVGLYVNCGLGHGPRRRLPGRRTEIAQFRLVPGPPGTEANAHARGSVGAGT